MAYSTISKPSLHFNTKPYTGNGSTQSITGVGFQPDFTWLKSRSNANVHALFDVVRGVTKRISSNDSSAEYTEAGALTAFDSDGFSLGNWTSTNGNGHTLASWNWKAGTAFTNDASSTGIGTIDSTGSFNNDNGFSIVSYTGTGSNGTIKHGLNSAPKMILIKQRSGTRTWLFGHNSLGWDKYLLLSSTDTQGTSSSYFQSTAPTTSVFSVGTGNETNESGGTYIAYCFTEKKGYSKFGSYTGNGSTDGTFVYTGFKPAFVMIKSSSVAEAWWMFDSKRSESNVANNGIIANGSNTEYSNSATFKIDMLSNGFKTRHGDAYANGSGQTYIYMAFAEEPLVANVGQSIPATAR